MAEFEKTLLFASIIICAVSSVLHIVGWIFNKESIFRSGRALIWLFFVLNTATIAVRWRYAGHGPYITIYEVLMSHVWIATLFFLIISSKWKGLKVIGVFAMPIIFLSIGAVTMAPAEASKLTPAYRSIWLIMHVLFAKLAYGSILVATALSLTVILRAYINNERHTYIGHLPEAERADILSYKMIVASLFFASIMIITGSIWANQLWGKYWGWDPIEVWSLVTWIIYGLYLHLRITFKFKGVKAAFYVMFAFIVSVFSFFIMPFFMTTVHNSFMKFIE